MTATVFFFITNLQDTKQGRASGSENLPLVLLSARLGGLTCPAADPNGGTAPQRGGGVQGDAVRRPQSRHHLYAAAVVAADRHRNQLRPAVPYDGDAQTLRAEEQCVGGNGQ